MAMTPAWFHQHLIDCNCELLHFTGNDYRHAIYKNPSNSRKFTILKDCDEVFQEIVLTCCFHLEIPVPGGNKILSSEEYRDEMNKNPDAE